MGIRIQNRHIACAEVMQPMMRAAMFLALTSSAIHAKNVWSGAGKSQDELMAIDQCIWVTEADGILGSKSKKEAHVFSSDRPRGYLHRAFSVFLFDAAGRLLLQQRAASKITFPSVWTNTVCSHPLTGLEPSEVDTARAIADGTVPGAKHAAVRKLLHELGIPSDEVPVDEFKYLTRLHYWAADTVTYGDEAPWGEHEVDYILFIRPSKNVTISPDPDEAMDHKYVTRRELAEMMADPTLLWSPWFRIIAEKFLPAWWADLDRTLKTDDLVDLETIHFFDPAEEHYGAFNTRRTVYDDGADL